MSIPLQKLVDANKPNASGLGFPKHYVARAHDAGVYVGVGGLACVCAGRINELNRAILSRCGCVGHGNGGKAKVDNFGYLVDRLPAGAIDAGANFAGDLAACDTRNDRGGRAVEVVDAAGVVFDEAAFN